MFKYELMFKRDFRMAHENKHPTTLMLSPRVLDSIKREAARERRSISNMVERLVERALERRDGVEA
jgi:hypothetical protein